MCNRCMQRWEMVSTGSQFSEKRSHSISKYKNIFQLLVEIYSLIITKRSESVTTVISFRFFSWVPRRKRNKVPLTSGSLSPTWSDDDPRRRLPAGDVSRCVGICRNMEMEMQRTVRLHGRKHSVNYSWLPSQQRHKKKKKRKKPSQWASALSRCRLARMHNPPVS